MNTNQIGIGTARGKPLLSLYGTSFGGAECAAVAAVERYHGGFRVLCLQTVSAQQLAEKTVELKRDLARMVEHQTARINKSSFALVGEVEPRYVSDKDLPPGAQLSRSRPVYANALTVGQQGRDAQKAADKLAEQREGERLDALAAGFVAKAAADGPPDLDNLRTLLDANRIVAASTEPRQRLAWVRSAFAQNVSGGVLADALCRAIQACGK